MGIKSDLYLGVELKNVYDGIGGIITTNDGAMSMLSSSIRSRRIPGRSEICGAGSAEHQGGGEGAH